MSQPFGASTHFTNKRNTKSCFTAEEHILLHLLLGPQQSEQCSPRKRDKLLQVGTPVVSRAGARGSGEAQWRQSRLRTQDRGRLRAPSGSQRL